MFALVDCNNFFVSCERIFQPKLAGQPTIVLSSNDGCVISRSNEAKALGIPMGAPLFKIKEFCKKEAIHTLSSNLELYADISSRIMAFLRACIPETEVYSIDEAFLNLNGIPDPENFVQNLKENIQKQTGVPVSIGVGRTKTLAKIATELAKKNPVYNGIFVCNNPYVEEAILERTPVENIWGIGRKLSKKLKETLNIHTALTLRNANPIHIKSLLSVTVERIIYELQGLSCLAIESIKEAQKSMIYSRAFGQRIHSLPQLEEALATYASRFAEKLRKEKQITTGILVIIRSSPFVTNRAFYKGSSLQPCDPPTSDTQAIIKSTLTALRSCYKPNIAYQKAGIIATQLLPETPEAMGLFSEPQKHIPLDDINKKFGKDTLRYAITGSKTTLSHWRQSPLNKSKCYTTKWGELLQVK